MEINTPLIDAALADIRTARRFSVAKTILTTALEAKSIYNVEYTIAKEDVTKAIEKALEPVWNAWFALHRDVIHNSRYGKLYAIYDIVGYSVQLNHIKGKIKRLSKYIVDVPDFLPYFDMLVEAYQFVTIFETLKPVIIKGRKPSENPKVVDLTHTASCAICGLTFKMTSSQTMVEHGFHITNGYGQYLGGRTTSCFGAFRKPSELSCEANAAFKLALEANLNRTELQLAALQNGEVTELPKRDHASNRSVMINPGHPYFPRLLDQAIDARVSEIRHIKLSIGDQEKIIKDWVRKPLYDEIHAPKEVKC